MKLLRALVSLFTAVLIVPLALCTPISHNANQFDVFGKTTRGHRAVREGHVPTTNAERFARGLPPLSPSKSRHHGSPTRREAASPVPLKTYRGYIDVSASDGSHYGYIGAEGYYYSYYDYAKSSTDNLVVTFSLPVGQTSGSALNILAENLQKPNTNNLPYFGLASSSSLQNGGLADLCPTAESMQEGPFNGANALGNTYIESAVWEVNIETGDMRALWTNADGTVTEGVFMGGRWSTIYYGLSTATSYPRLSFKFVAIE